jgi:hypothetical protein
VGREDAFSDDIDWLDVGSDAPGQATPPRRPWPRWFTVVVVLTAVALVLTVLNRERGVQSAARLSTAPTTSAPPPTPTQTPTSTQTAPETSTAPTTALPAVSVTQLDRPLLGATTGWELIGYGDAVLVRIELAAGRITRTAIPSFPDNGAATLLAGTDRVRIQPFDRTPSFLVPDGKPFRELPALKRDGLVFPGPAANQMWMESGDSPHPVMTLATLDGGKLAGSLPIPPELSAYDAVADGAGGLLFPGASGVYAAQSNGLRRISTGSLAAVGPTGWLVTECDDRYRCQTVLIGRADRSRRTVNPPLSVRSPRGSISPDGATAAVMIVDFNGDIALHLLDLASGSQRVLKVFTSDEYGGAGIVWSPDSSWVFTLTAQGTLVVLNRETGGLGGLNMSLPPLNQLVVRPGG